LEQFASDDAASGFSGNPWERHELVLTTRTGNAIEPRNLARSFERAALPESSLTGRGPRLRWVCPAGSSGGLSSG